MDFIHSTMILILCLYLQILLAIASVVSLAVGIYETVAVPEYDSQGNRIPGVKWVEGVAIIVAIIIVVLAGSINDFQKDKQFRKLNAKKEDRLVKVYHEMVVFYWGCSS